MGSCTSKNDLTSSGFCSAGHWITNYDLEDKASQSFFIYDLFQGLGPEQLLSVTRKFEPKLRASRDSIHAVGFQANVSSRN